MFRSLFLPISTLFLYISSFEHNALGKASPYGHHTWHPWSQSQPSRAPGNTPSPGFDWNHWGQSQRSQDPANIPSSPTTNENSQFVRDVRRPNNQQTGTSGNITPLPLAKNVNAESDESEKNRSQQPEALANNLTLTMAENVHGYECDRPDCSPSQHTERPATVPPLPMAQDEISQLIAKLKRLHNQQPVISVNITPQPLAKNGFNCTLPPYGRYLSFLVTEPKNKSIIYGHKLRTYSLIWSCDVGYGLLGFKTMNCYEDGSTDTGGELPECVRHCKMESNNIVVINKKPRCIPPPIEEKAIPTRFQTKVNKIKEFQGCGTDMTNGPDVAGGRTAEEKELPWHAGIYTKNTKPYMQICGGSIIHKLVIISAAHCFWSELEKQLPASNFAVAAGKQYRHWNDQHDKYPQKSDVADIKIPSYFQGSSTNLQDDIALVLVTVPFEFSGDFKVYPICVDFDLEKDKTQLTPGSYGKVGGWGLTSEDGPASPVLKVVDMPVIDIKQCFEESDPSFKPFITSDKICAGYENGTAVCKGDSGGGLAIRETFWPHRHYLRGVVSVPASDHLCNTYAWASFTRIQRHEAFITEVIRSLPNAESDESEKNRSQQPEALDNNLPLTMTENVTAQGDASERTPSQVSEAPLSNTTPVNNDNFNCTLPQMQANGGFYMTGVPLSGPFVGPGDKVKTYTIYWYCHLKFTLLGFNTTNCYEDGNTDTEIPECVPTCKVESNNMVVVNTGHPRCILPILKEAIPSPLKMNKNKTEEYEGCTAGAYRGTVAGGRPAEEKELPWHAAIYTKNTKPYMQICGGSIIHKSVIISAAHCFWSEIEKQLPASNFAVAAGKLYRPWDDQQDKKSQKSDVADIKLTPYFQGSSTNLQDDIALVIVTDPFEFSGDLKVYPICVDFDLEKDKTQLTPGSYGKVGGWGLTSEDGPASPVLKVVDMPVIDIKQCFETSDPTFKSYITSDKICAGYDNGTAVCKGDSGGGLVFKQDYYYYLRGIVSGAPASDHECNTYAWASFTHIQRHEAFITEVMRKLPSDTETNDESEEEA